MPFLGRREGRAALREARRTVGEGSVVAVWRSLRKSRSSRSINRR